ncbi:lantibiotic protection ABC transporter ATP-binding protein [Anaerocolumna sp. AGMB13025]|uniref:lantibiotic protection ABC transporter ATP-binding protein n=1 Tax=Anaerocolumna sp. AGMB13025 TaxID=3039116 RepID=UPI00241EDDD3|nr:lantibiotic protection ABC transporter ATP-binding protein [Anaerocolumna sp. AGMB13025]WFR60280.1 lantibiotic protection ABC transporter ATP-binding protein [Anaerocolumna sp. AGMB13025]
MNEYIIKTNNISKKFKKTYAIKELSMSVRKNSVYGLLGPNGAGKSTLLKMITGIIRPTSGQILFNNHSWTRKDLINIGSLIESPPLYENLTAYENIKVRGTLMGISEDKWIDVLQKMDLMNTKNKKTAEFSLGMKQRLGIALALLNNPQLLILDEPTNGLDPFGIEELRSMIKTFADSGISVIISSHILSEVQQVVDDIGIIYNGSLLYQDKIDANENLEQLFMDIVRKERVS